jgi:hypothetical protein
MTSKDQTEKSYDSEELLKRAHECKGEDFNELLKEIEDALRESENDEKLLRAKKAVTARIASRG